MFNKHLLQQAICRTKTNDLLVFAYGSLMWNPGFDFDERQPTRVFGYCRRLAIYSTLYRGTARQPGLVFGLDYGGSCNGYLYHIKKKKSEVTTYLFEREIVTNAYSPHFIKIKGQKYPALTFVIRRDNPLYAPPMPLRKVATIIKQASGKSGANKDYIQKAYQSLVELGHPPTWLSQLQHLLNCDKNG